MLRSIAVYYSKGIMDKDKYRRIYKASSYKQGLHILWLPTAPLLGWFPTTG